MDSCIVMIIVRLRKLLDTCAWNTTCSSPKWYGVVLSNCSASFDENSQFIIAMLRTVVQNLIIYNLSPQDADQLLEKRVRSRFSHRKILFLPPSKEEVDSLLEHLLSLPTDSSFPSGYVSQFNEKIKNITSDTRFKDMLRTFLNANSTVNSLLKFIFRAVSSMNLESGLLSLETFKAALSSMQRQPKLEAVRDCSILELYLLVCMRRLEVKEQSLYNFISVMKEYKTIHDSFQTSDHYAQNVCLRAFEHLREREVICYAENRGQSQTGEYRPMKLLILASELHQGMRSHACCPVVRETERNLLLMPARSPVKGDNHSSYRLYLLC
ncbi:hypothetical protein Bca101_051043 [Brassica carinata]